MKTSRTFCSLLLAGLLTSFTAQAADPPPSAADGQALMALLNKIVAQSASAESSAPDEPAPASAVPPPAPQPAAPSASAPAAKLPLSTALKTGSLSGASLAPSSGLGGRGAGTVARLTEEAWRLLFPAKQPGN